MTDTVNSAAPSKAPTPVKRRGSVARIFRGALAARRGQVGLALTLLVVGLAFIGPFIPSESATDFAGMPYSLPGNGNGVLGTDALGRDVLARLLQGGWSLLLLAATSTVLAVLLGAVAGVVAAYRGKMTETLIMRTVDVMLAIPQLVFVLLIVSVIGAKPWLVVVGVTLCQAPQVARVMYASAQDICERDFVKAVALWGVPPRTVITRHIMPSLTTPLAVESGLRLSFSIILIAGLNFLGFGTQPPNPSWGVMVNENRLGLATNYWGVLAPAIVLAILAVGTNVFADALARVAFGGERGEDAPSVTTLELTTK
ncbi:MAG: peptide/nickel transport system permease protein [Mycobacterium sp.]|nr:peptide/nickel transport system permease protein [Mycobacterium sp.]